jgi:hypothetical protein
LSRATITAEGSKSPRLPHAPYTSDARLPAPEVACITMRSSCRLGHVGPFACSARSFDIVGAGLKYAAASGSGAGCNLRSARRAPARLTGAPGRTTAGGPDPRRPSARGLPEPSSTNKSLGDREAATACAALERPGLPPQWARGRILARSCGQCGRCPISTRPDADPEPAPLSEASTLARSNAVASVRPASLAPTGSMRCTPNAHSRSPPHSGRVQPGRGPSKAHRIAGESSPVADPPRPTA